MRENILSRLQKVSGRGNRYKACCPAHDDRTPSLSILFHDDGRTLMHCHAGCDVADVLASIGLSMSDLYPDGAIRDFMASAAQKPKTNRYDAWLEVFERQKQQCKREGTRLSPETLQLAREMYKRRGYEVV